MSKRAEVDEYLERAKPDVLILCETKWKDEWPLPDIGKNKYEVWMKNRDGKEGGGVMILTEKRCQSGKSGNKQK